MDKNERIQKIKLEVIRLEMIRLLMLEKKQGGFTPSELQECQRVLAESKALQKEIKGH